MSRVGTRVGDYEIKGLIGEGGMGVVYRARHVAGDRLVALKVLNDQCAGMRDAVAQLVGEAKATNRLHHPNIADVTDVGTTPDGTVFLAMEYLEGESLRDRLRQAQRVPLFEATNIVRQVTRALGAAHEAGLVHAGFKPSSIFLCKRDGRRRIVRRSRAKGMRLVVEAEESFDLVKLLDFGMAGFLDLSLGAHPHYLSPEQAQMQPADQRSDIYGLGVVFYEMVTGNVPFGGESLADIIRGQAAGLVIAPSRRTPGAGIDGHMDALILRCLKKNPLLRFATTGELCAALDACVTDCAFLRDAHRLPGIAESGIDLSEASPQARQDGARSAEKPSVAPVAEKPVVAPVAHKPSPTAAQKPAPVAEKPAGAPTAQKPSTAPAAQRTTAPPVAEKPAVAPVLAKPAAAPVEETAVPAPVAAKPVAAAQQPAKSPAAQAPARDPIADDPAAAMITPPPVLVAHAETPAAPVSAPAAPMADDPAADVPTPPPVVATDMSARIPAGFTDRPSRVSMELPEALISNADERPERSELDVDDRTSRLTVSRRPRAIALAGVLLLGAGIAVWATRGGSGQGKPAAPTTPLATSAPAAAAPAAPAPAAPVAPAAPSATPAPPTASAPVPASSAPTPATAPLAAPAAPAAPAALAPARPTSPTPTAATPPAAPAAPAAAAPVAALPTPEPAATAKIAKTAGRGPRNLASSRARPAHAGNAHQTMPEIPGPIETSPKVAAPVAEPESPAPAAQAEATPAPKQEAQPKPASAATTEAEPTPSARPNVDDLVREAQRTWMRGHYAAAISKAQAALRAEPTRAQAAQAYEIIAISSCSLGDANAAREAASHLGDAKREMVNSVCKKNGLTIE